MEQTETGPQRRWPDWLLLAILAGLSAAVHGWLVWTAEVPARDSVGFIRFAIELERGPVIDVLRGTHQHPLYPAAVLAASWPLRHVMNGPMPQVMVLSSHLVSCVAALLLVLPVFYLGRELFDRRVGFWSAALLQCLPTTAHTTADGLTEGLFLLLAATALLLAARALRRGVPFLFALSGLCGGLAYLTRPEGAATVAAAGTVLLGAQVFKGWRRPWGRVLVCGGCLALGALLAAGPYMAAIGGLSNKPTSQQFLHGQHQDDWAPGVANVGDSLRESLPLAERVAYSGHPATLLAVWWLETGSRPPWWWGVQAVTLELLKGFYYVALLPALLGIYWFRSRWRSAPAAWLLIVLSIFQLMALWRMAHVAGYVSERHVQLVVLAGSFWAVAAVLAIGDYLAARVRRAWPALVLPALLVGSGLPAALRPLHPGHAGHLAASGWLAANLRADDIIFDPLGYASLYAGRVLQRSSVPKPTAKAPCYVVLEDRTKPHPSVPQVGPAIEMVRRGEPVFHWEPTTRGERAQAVSVYRLAVPRDDSRTIKEPVRKDQTIVPSRE